jgi:UDP-glucuronate decarboxylase
MHPNDGRVVSNFIVSALTGRPVTLYGDGSQTRSFCHVDDTVEGLIRLMDSPDEVTGPINIGNPDEMSVRELATRIIELTGAKVEMEELELPADDPKVRQPDITRAREILGWAPKVPLDEGLRSTIAYFRELLDQPVVS